MKLNRYEAKIIPIIAYKAEHILIITHLVLDKLHDFFTSIEEGARLLLFVNHTTEILQRIALGKPTFEQGHHLVERRTERVCGIILVVLLVACYYILHTSHILFLSTETE